MKMSAKVYRAATGKWEDLGVIAEQKHGFVQRVIDAVKGVFNGYRTK
jgi:hypothetical protein